MLEQGPIFGSRSLHPRDVNQHLHIDMEHAHCLAMVLLHPPFNEKNFPGFCYGGSTVS
jgi:hypothetical protein